MILPKVVYHDKVVYHEGFFLSLPKVVYHDKNEGYFLKTVIAIISSNRLGNTFFFQRIKPPYLKLTRDE